jgi:hypothetical protein
MLGHLSALAVGAGWKRFGSLLLHARRSIPFRTPRVALASSGFERRRWCRWFDPSPNAEAAARHEPKPYVSPPPKSVLARMTSPPYPPRRAKQRPSTRPRASEPKRVGSVRRWVSALLDSVPSVSPQGEAGGGEAAAKAPRWIKHDRGQSELPQTSNTNRSRPDGSNPVTTGSPSRGPVCPHTHSPSHPAAGSRKKLAPT